MKKLETFCGLLVIVGVFAFALAPLAWGFGYPVKQFIGIAAFCAVVSVALIAFKKVGGK